MTPEFKVYFLFLGQEGPQTRVGIATFDSTIHFYNLNKELQTVCFSPAILGPLSFFVLSLPPCSQVALRVLFGSVMLFFAALPPMVQFDSNIDRNHTCNLQISNFVF